MAYTAQITIQYRFGLGGIHPPQIRTSVTHESMEALVRDIATRFPLTYTRRRAKARDIRPRVRIDMHNGAGLDIDCHISEAMEPGYEEPRNRAPGSMNLQAYITTDDRITDATWADAIEGLRAAGVRQEQLDIGREPSDRWWSVWPSSMKRQCAPDEHAIARGRAAAQAPAWDVTDTGANRWGQRVIEFEPTTANARAMRATTDSDGQWLVFYADLPAEARTEFASDADRERALDAIRELATVTA